MAIKDRLLYEILSICDMKVPEAFYSREYINVQISENQLSEEIWDEGIDNIDVVKDSDRATIFLKCGTKTIERIDASVESIRNANLPF